jgi:hypothetical protein
MHACMHACDPWYTSLHALFSILEIIQLEINPEIFKLEIFQIGNIPNRKWKIRNFPIRN